jgi:hypothetical protein
MIFKAKTFERDPKKEQYRYSLYCTDGEFHLLSKKENDSTFVFEFYDYPDGFSAKIIHLLRLSKLRLDYTLGIYPPCWGMGYPADDDPTDYDKPWKTEEKRLRIKYVKTMTMPKYENYVKVRVVACKI